MMSLVCNFYACCIALLSFLDGRCLCKYLISASKSLKTPKSINEISVTTGITSHPRTWTIVNGRSHTYIVTACLLYKYNNYKYSKKETNTTIWHQHQKFFLLTDEHCMQKELVYY